MALNKLKFNSLNVTTAASKVVSFNSSANGFDTAGGAMRFITTNTTASSGTSIIKFYIRN